MKKFGWTVWGILGFVFAPIGLLFLLIGGMVSPVSSSFQSMDGPAVFRYTFCGMGGLFFLLGAGFLFRDLRRRYRLRQAFYGGYMVDARITAVREIRNANRNGSHPFVIECVCTDSSGEEHVYRSRYLYKDPGRMLTGTTIPVYVDRMNGKIGFVDVESIIDRLG